MKNIDDLVAKSIELNNAIKKLKEETKTINSILEEKRTITKNKMLDDLQKYADIMEPLGITCILLRTSRFMHYKELTRRLGIQIRLHDLNTNRPWMFIYCDARILCIPFYRFGCEWDEK